ncbi:MAG: Fe-S cluster assembly protein SufD [Vicinamibacteria bacterium]|nr:Fe-S cluster assembly protein SufD [Vicinamibacteria bacterium]
MNDPAPVGYPTALGAPRFDSRNEAPWMHALRRSMFESYMKRGMPTPKDEDWRHTNVSSIATTPFLAAASTNGRARARDAIESWDLGREVAAALVFIDGRYSPELSALPKQDAFQAGPLEALWRRADGPLPKHFGRVLGENGHAFADLNTAYAEDGAFVAIARGRVIERPIYLLFISLANGTPHPAVSHPRTLVLAESGSRAAIVSVYGGASEDLYLTNAVTEIVIEDGATVEHDELQIESPRAFHVSTLAGRAGRDGRFVDRSFVLGARLARRDVIARLDGEGGECELDGLYLGNGTRHIDAHTRIDHASPHTSSREIYKGILDGRSHGVFHGRIVVRPDAQKIDARQVNKNLILSDAALANSTPQLQIHADDVRCTHASTIGQIDPVSLFYLRSRGIDESAARNLLTYAFACEIAGKVRIPGLRGGIARLLQSRLPGAPMELCP